MRILGIFASAVLGIVNKIYLFATKLGTISKSQDDTATFTTSTNFGEVGQSWEVIPFNGGQYTLSSVEYANGLFLVSNSSYTDIIKLNLSNTNQLIWGVARNSFTTNPRRLAYGNNTWIAVSDNPRMLKSTDLVIWTTQTSNFGNTSITSVGYGNGLWIAVGYTGQIRTSTDASSWTTQTSNFGNTTINDVYYGNGLWTIVGNANQIRTSTDGSTWNTQTSGTSDDFRVLINKNNIWVAGGSSGTVITSTDATTWTSRTSNFGLLNINAITYGNGTWIIAGSSGNIRTSTDTISWTTRTSNHSNTIYSAEYGNGIFLLGADAGEMRSSTDGITWITESAFYNNRNGIYGMAYGNEKIAAVGTRFSIFTEFNKSPYPLIEKVATGMNTYKIKNLNNKTIAVGSIGGTGGLSESTDTVTWITRTTNFSGIIYDINYGHGKYLIAGQSGGMRSSTDLITWTTVASNIGTNSKRAVGYGNGLFAVGGQSNNNIHMSTDLVTWTTYHSSMQEVRSIQYSTENSLWIIGGIIRSSAGVATSDGSLSQMYSTWVTRTSNTTSHLTSAYYGNGLWIAVGYSGTIRSSTDTVTWTTQTSNFGTSNIRSVIYGNGVWVAGGSSGSLRTSTDGITWTTQTSNFGSTDIRSVGYGNNVWLAGGYGGTLRTSTDTVTWTTRTSNINSLVSDFSYGKGLWVAIGGNASIRTSTDTVTWTTQTSNFANNATVNNIVYGNGAFIAGAGQGTNVTGIRRSTDGITWTSITLLTSGATPNNPITGADYGDGLFIVAEGNAFYVSTDGISWDQKEGESNTDIRYGNGTWLLTDYSGRIKTTTQSSTLNFITRYIGGSSIENIKKLNNIWHAVGYYRAYATSTNGTTWTRNISLRSGSANANQGNSIIDIAYGNSNYVAIPGGDFLYLSRNKEAKSITYTTVTAGNNFTTPLIWTTSEANVSTNNLYYNRLMYGNGSFVIVNNNGNIRTSTDAVTWVTRTSNVSETLSASIYGNQLWVVGGYSGRIITSTDLITWITRTSNFGSSNISGVSYGNGIFIASGASGQVRTSTDAITWTTQTSNTTTAIDKLTYGNGSFIGSIFGSGTIRSTDGISWTTSGLPSSIAVSIAYGNGKFIISDTSYLYYSNDNGVTWTSSPEFNEYVNNIVYGNGVFAAIKRQYDFVFSTDLITWATINHNIPIAGVPDFSNDSQSIGLAYGNGMWVAGRGSFSYPSTSVLKSNAAITSSNIYLAGFNSGEVLLSTDSTTWITVPGPIYNNNINVIDYDANNTTSLTSWTLANVFGGNTTSFLYTVAYGNGQYVSAGSSAFAAASGDGLNWIRIPNASYGGDIRSSAYGNGLFILVGNSGVVATSETAYGFNVKNGNFAFSGSVPGGFGTSNIRSIDYGNGIFVASGDANQLRTTQVIDAHIWSGISTNMGTSYINTAFYGNNLWLISGVGGSIRTSTDGYLWTTRTSNFATGNTSILTYGNGLYIASAFGQNTIRTSTDGITWITQGSTMGIANIYSGVYGNGQWVVVGQYGRISSSTDTITWTTRTGGFSSEPSSNIYSIVYANGKFITAGQSVISPNSYARIEESTDLVTWTTRLDNIGAYWNDLKYENNIYVAVGLNGRISTSTDAVTWTTRTSNFSNNSISKVVYGNGIWIANSYTNNYRVSTDAITWTTQNSTFGSTNINMVGYGNGSFIMVGSSGTAKIYEGYNAKDIATWITRTSNLATTTISTVKYGNNLWVIGSYSGGIATSTDTITWVSMTSNTTAPIFEISYGNGRWVAVGGTGGVNMVRSSTDAVTWTTVSFSLFPGYYLNSVDYGNGLWYLTSPGGTRPARSTDTVTWTTSLEDVLTMNQGIGSNGSVVAEQRIRYLNNSWIGVGSSTRIKILPKVLNNSSGAIVSSNGLASKISKDLFSWTTLTLKNTSPYISNNTIGISKTDRYKTIVGQNGLMLTSDKFNDNYNEFSSVYNRNGMLFKSTIIHDSGVTAFEYGNGIWALGTSGGGLKTSTDFVTWTTRTPNVGNSTVTDISYANGIFVLVGGDGHIRTSTDAVTWTTRTSNFGSTRIESVKYGNGIWVAVGYVSQIRRSTDAITWTTQTNTAIGNATIRGIGYGNGRFVAVSENGTTNSTDGITWKLSHNIGAHRAIAYGNGIFLAGGSFANMNKSTDGIVWQKTAAHHANTTIYKIIYANGMWVVVPNSPPIMISTDTLTWMPPEYEFNSSEETFAGRGMWSIAYGNGIFAIGMGSGRVLYSQESSITNAISASQIKNTFNNLPIIASSDKIYYTMDSKKYLQEFVARYFNTYSGVHGPIGNSYSNFNGKKIVGNRWFSLGTVTAANQNDFTSTSTDAITWTTINSLGLGTTGSMVKHLIYGNGIWVAGTSISGKQVSKSTDLLTWQQVINNLDSHFDRIQAIEYGNGLWTAAVGSYGYGPSRIVTSTDLVTWTSRALTFGTTTTQSYFTLVSSAYNGSEWLIGQQNPSTVYRTTDFITWTTREKIYGSSAFSNSMRKVAYEGDISLALTDTGNLYYSTDGKKWYPSSSGAGNGAYGIVYGNGNFVSVAQSGIIKVGKPTTDHITWITTTGNNIMSSFSDYPTGLRYGNGLWAFTSNVGIRTSTDRISWITAGNISSSRTIAYGNQVWVVGNNSGQIQTSTDTITWTTRTSNISEDLISSSYGNGTFIVGSSSGGIRSSTDAITWTTRTSNVSASSILGIEYGNGIFVFGATSGNIRTSTDGITWTTQTSNFGSTAIRAIAYGNGIWVAVGSSTQIRQSTDAITWTTATFALDFGTRDFKSVKYGDGRWIITAANLTSISTDLISWTPYDELATISGDSIIEYGNGQWVIVGSAPTSTVKYSDAKIKSVATWVSTTSNFGNTHIKAIAYGNGIFVAGGENGVVRTSTNGSSWTTVTTTNFTGSNTNDIGYGNGLWIIVAGNQMRTSTDTVTWTTQTSNFVNNSIYSVVYGNSIWVAAGSSGYIRTSTDGVTWTTRTSNTAANLLSVEYGNNIFVATGDNFATIRTSTDAITWTTRTISALEYSQSNAYIKYANGLMVVGGSTYTPAAPWLIRSTDCITWTSTSSDTLVQAFGPVVAIEYGNGIWGISRNRSQLPHINITTDFVTWTSTGYEKIPSSYWIHGVVGNNSYQPANLLSYANGNFYVALDSYSMLSKSTNLVTWTTVNYTRHPGLFDQDEGLATIYSVTYGNGKLLLGGDRAFLLQDTFLQDNLNIKNLDTNIIVTDKAIIKYDFLNKWVPYDVTSVASVKNAYTNPENSRYVLIGDNTPTAWVTVSSNIDPMLESIFSSRYGNGLFVIGGTGGSIRTSTNAVSWTTRTSNFGNNQLRGIAYGNGLWIIAGAAGTVRSSTDTITWTTVTSNFDDGNKIIYAAEYGNGVFLITGANGQVKSSTDTITWTSAFKDAGNETFVTMTYGNGLFAIGATTLRTSTDGATWTTRTSNFATGIKGISYGNGIWVAVGYSGQIRRSTDVITWTTATSNFGATNINQIGYGSGLFTAAGTINGGIRTSTDGITWNTQGYNYTDSAIYTIAYGNGTWIAGSNNGARASFINQKHYSTDLVTWTRFNDGPATSDINFIEITN